MSEILKGTIEGIIYRNPENGYSVLEISGDDGMLFVAVGSVALANEGEHVELNGAWTEHKTYGKQFKVSNYKVLPPTTAEEIETYLGSGSIRGVGKSVAKQIVDMFGTDTFNVLDNTPELLLNLPGIGAKKYEMIITSYNQQRVNRSVMMQMQSLDISTAQAMKLYRRYGDDCVKIIRENPYRLIDDIENIGFKTADKIAQKVGIAFDSDFRVRAGVMFLLEWARQEGHTYLPHEVLVSATATTINVDDSLVRTAVENLIGERKLVCNDLDDKQIVFLPYMRQMEMNIAVRLTDIAIRQKKSPEFDVDEEMKSISQKSGIILEKKQSDAIKAMFTKGVVVITGGPGTGKTTILKVAIELMRLWGMTYELAAPTGRAAKRMTAATGASAQTLHRLLEYSFTEQTFLRDETDPIDADFIIIDEMSMVDVSLMNSFLKAVTEKTRLIFVGDADQLPSVGAGNVLRDLLDSGKLHSVRLTEVYRQAACSMIVSNAHNINNGINPQLDDGEGDFVFHEIFDQNEILERILQMFRSGRENDDEIMQDAQLLAPMKKGILGVINLNKCLQHAINPPSRQKAELNYGETAFREGDKVMQIKNNYSIEWTKSQDGRLLEEGKGIFNGDIGAITYIDVQNRIVEVEFEDGATAQYTPDLFEELEHAYCISIHKSQGSEFKTVLLALAGGPPGFLTRNLLYTAVTRAKSHVCILGRRETVNSMVANKSTKSRYTALRFMLEEYYDYCMNIGG